MILFLALFLGFFNTVDYQIDAKLDYKTHTLKGFEVVTYHNNSPDTLYYLWFHLYPNAFKPKSTIYKEVEEWFGKYNFRYLPPWKKKKYMGWLTIDSVKIGNSVLKPDSKNTLLKLDLPEPILPHDSLKFKIWFREKLPKFYSRMGWKGSFTALAYWYPKVAVYDSRGWHPIDYHVWGEFYADFGKYDVKLTVPENVIAGFTGNLMAPKKYMDFLDSLSAIDPLELANKQKKKVGISGKTVTLHIVADSVHDVTIMLDPEFVPMKKEVDGKTYWILALPQNVKLYKDMLDEVPKIIKTYEKWYGPYPYKKFTVVDGFVGVGGGMEYPQLVVIQTSGRGYKSIPVPKSKGLKKYGLIDVIAHETAHQWFFGMLANNQMDEAFLDEAFATFSEARYMLQRFPVDSVKKMAGMFFKSTVVPGQTPLEAMMTTGIYATMNSPFDEPVWSGPAYLMESYGTVVYGKGEKILKMLRFIVGPEMFDSIMHVYYRRYRFKHPHIEDFVKTCEEVSQMDLDWFFDTWLTTTKTPEFSVKRVFESEKGTVVQIENKGVVEMPVLVEVKTKNGDYKKVLKRGYRRVVFEGVKGVKKVIIDPYNDIPEHDEWDNEKPRSVQVSLFSMPLPSRLTIYTWPFLTYFGKDYGYSAYLIGLGTQGTVRHQFFNAVGFNFKFKKLNLLFSLTEPIKKGEGNFGITFMDQGGFREFRFGFSRTWQYYPFGAREWRNSLEFDVLDFYNPEMFDREIYEKTRYFKLQWTYTWKFANPLWHGKLKSSYFVGFRNNEIFKGFSTYLNAQMFLPPEPIIDLRLVDVSKNSPLQEKPFVRGEVLPEMPFRFFLPYKGTASTASLKRFSIGTGLIYKSPYEQKTKILALRIKVPFKLFGFYHEAVYTYENKKIGRIGYDGGIFLKIAMLNIMKPLYPESVRKAVSWHINLNI